VQNDAEHHPPPFLRLGMRIALLLIALLCKLRSFILTHYFEWLHLIENEHVLLPLSNFSIVGMRRETDPSFPNSGEVNVLEIKLNGNLKAQSLAEMEKNRQSVLLHFVQNLNMETKQFLSRCPNHVIENESISDQEKKLLQRITKQDPTVFNDTQRFQNEIESLSKMWRSFMEKVM